jgi:hypothetical protein
VRTPWPAFSSARPRRCCPKWHNQANGEEGRPNAKTILAPARPAEAVVDVDGPAIKVAMHGPGDSERHPGAGMELGALGGELIDLIWNRQIGPGL